MINDHNYFLTNKDILRFLKMFYFLPLSFVRITSIDMIVLHPSRKISAESECCCIQINERSRSLYEKKYMCYLWNERNLSLLG